MEIIYKISVIILWAIMIGSWFFLVLMATRWEWMMGRETFWGKDIG